ncbi:hypothetical protein M0R45_027630 [Rubus argutus]|uniref:Uncharacterized protein n=1 Tax=Rubus argutus TaxID=59490 RepID=A0AAW1X2L7_RUBAR
MNEMWADYVLPVSKDMPGSDELFDEVMFVELNREESQRRLDEMQDEVSNLNSNSSSLYSFSTGSWSISYSSVPPNYQYHMLNQVSEYILGPSCARWTARSFEGYPLPPPPVPWMHLLPSPPPPPPAPRDHFQNHLKAIHVHLYLG